MKNLILICILALCHSQTSIAQAKGNLEFDRISVNGVGELEIEPDTAWVTIGVETKAKQANEAQKKNAKIANQISSTLIKNYKIQKKDIQTSNFNVRAEYNYQKNVGRVFVGYVVNNEILIRIRNISKLGNVLDDLSTAGMNTMNGIRFDTSKRAEFELKAIGLAMESARKKADVLAKSAGRTIQKVRIIDTAAHWNAHPRPMMGKMMALAETARSAPAPTPIAGGQLKIVANVSVVYEM